MRQTILTHFINAPIDKITPFFMNFSKFGEVHPLMKKVEKISENEATFYETVKISGFIPHNFSYPAKMTRNENNNSVTMFAEPKPSVFLELKFDFFQEANRTKIIEEINIEASYLVSRILKRQVVKSHRKLVENIQTVLQ